MPEIQTIKVLVVDHRAVTASGISTILGGCTGFQVLGQAKNGEEALQIMQDYDPDIISIDIELPDPLSGRETIQRLRQKSLCARIVILTNLLDETVVRNVLREGVKGYLLKSASAEELIYAIRAAYQGTSVFSPEVTELLLREVTIPNGYHLTPREYEVLELLVQGWNNHDIAKQLNISLSTVQFHVSNILAKLEVHNRIEAATFAVRHNLAAYQKP